MVDFRGPHVQRIRVSNRFKKKYIYVGNTHSALLVVDVRERSWLFFVDEFRWSETSKLPVIIVLIADMIQYAQRFLSKQAAIISYRLVHIYSTFLYGSMFEFVLLSLP